LMILLINLKKSMNDIELLLDLLRRYSQTSVVKNQDSITINGLSVRINANLVRSDKVSFRFYSIKELLMQLQIGGIIDISESQTSMILSTFNEVKYKDCFKTKLEKI
jgi:hypothetical protein